MIRIGVTIAGSEAIRDAVDRLAAIDLRPLAETIRDRLVEGNHRGLDAGTDAHGNRLADLAESTLADRRRGPGGPMIPLSPGRRFIEGFRATVESAGEGGFDVIGEWDDVARFHRTAARTRNPAILRPARDIVGVRPEDRDLIALDVRAFAEELTRF